MTKTKTVTILLKSGEDCTLEGIEIVEKKKQRVHPGGSVIFYIDDSGIVNKIEERHFTKGKLLKR